jgi:cephalosporin-C deacetylase-like acetyl esterase
MVHYLSPDTLVIFSHGFGDNKEKVQVFAKELAKDGYFVVSLDNKCHGERKDETFFNIVKKGEKIDIFKVRQLIKETADDVVKLIDYYNTVDNINMSKIGMTGISMGGYATYRVGVIDSRVKILSPLIASPYWDEIPKDVKVINNCMETNEVKEYINKYTPSNNIDSFVDKKLLIQIGGKDKHYKLDRVVAFYKKIIKKLEKQGKEKKYINLIVHEQLGHEVNDEMLIVTKKWFRKNFED